jgi:hypothetical protein
VIRLALRQFRTEVIVAFVLLVALAVVLAVTGAHLVSVSDAFKSTCSAAHDCATTNPVLDVDSALGQPLEFIVIIAPALVGLFFGAPSSPARSRPAPSVSPGPRASPESAGWR